jgi:hypothetical protein
MAKPEPPRPPAASVETAKPTVQKKDLILDF